MEDDEIYIREIKLHMLYAVKKKGHIICCDCVFVNTVLCKSPEPPTCILL